MASCGSVRINQHLRACACALLLSLAAVSGALAAAYRPEGAVIGQESLYRTDKDDSLFEIARRHDLGVNSITAANPGTDPLIPSPQTLIVIPTQWILPDVAVPCGIVINIAEMRLYLFQEGSGEVITFPVGIGDAGKDTPLGTFAVIEKIVDPPWHVPRSIRRERPELPAVVPPGPNNPMGNRALRLSRGSVLIHGTNRPWGIGSRDSHGCIRLYPEDIEALFDLVGTGTRVTIVDQPVKAATLGDAVFLEVHDHREGRDLYREALRVLQKKDLLQRVDLGRVKSACRNRRGQLVEVSVSGHLLPAHYDPVNMVINGSREE